MPQGLHSEMSQRLNWPSLSGSRDQLEAVTTLKIVHFLLSHKAVTSISTISAADHALN